ncbi:MAG: hypothetical protein ABL914_06220 [Novosphingobium sp.]|uniref:hypothetical protein n=1 Tax=Novosphingobium sp. TaxID=1874826 RepID=UPI0032BD9DE3
MNGAVAEVQLPPGALLERYRAGGGHVDCYVAEVPRSVDLGQLITAFYTSRAFRPERWLLGALLGKRAGDDDVAQLASGQAARFSAWTVESRQGDEILLCDFQGRTRSWLMVMPIEGGTRLHFGSAVVPSASSADRAIFSLLLGFHRFYSRLLLGSAVGRL